MEDFQGCHSEWNLGNPGGWDYQRLTQTIGKTVWQKFNKIHNFDLDCECTYLLGPVRIALRSRLITSAQIAALRRYGQKLWDDCLTLEKKWLASRLGRGTKPNKRYRDAQSNLRISRARC